MGLITRWPTTRTVGEHVGPVASLNIHSRLLAFQGLPQQFPPPPPPLLHFLRLHRFESTPFQSLSRLNLFPHLFSPSCLGFPSSSIKMSSRENRITDEEINELISKLQSLLPESRRPSTSRASASKLLKETCNYIKSLRRDVDDLSDRLSDLLATMDSNSPQADIIRSLLRS